MPARSENVYLYLAYTRTYFNLVHTSSYTRHALDIQQHLRQQSSQPHYQNLGHPFIEQSSNETVIWFNIL
ncbi:hypothetical protein HJFPF1_13105 [Paramyrothecium foliicola]|nr:hypothetical protein HJFPF1_13105 [Paramyrothecium foliicola]